LDFRPFRRIIAPRHQYFAAASRDSDATVTFQFPGLDGPSPVEQEVATKERWLPWDVYLRAIAIEFAALTAMAGAVKELARLVPLEEDEKRLVNM